MQMEVQELGSSLLGYLLWCCGHCHGHGGLVVGAEVVVVVVIAMWSQWSSSVFDTSGDGHVAPCWHWPSAHLAIVAIVACCTGEMVVDAGGGGHSMWAGGSGTVLTGSQILVLVLVH